MDRDDVLKKYRVNPGLEPSQIVKSSGWDWVVYFLDDGGPEIDPVFVFGQMTAEDALKEARFAISDGNDTPYEIVAVVRQDKHNEFLKPKGGGT